MLGLRWIIITFMDLGMLNYTVYICIYVQSHEVISRSFICVYIYICIYIYIYAMKLQ